MKPGSITAAIPTYRREQVLLDTLEQLLTLDVPPAEILVLDQTRKHELETSKELARLDSAGDICWVCLKEPSITAAMNHALQIANNDIVLFLDDDIELTSEIVAEHIQAYVDETVDVVAGQVIQSWQSSLPDDALPYKDGNYDDPDAFLFNSSQRCWIRRFMGGNISIRKYVALEVGGFDENFIKVAYRFEAEFADRLLTAGHRILFLPDASIRHLKSESGGTRSYGEHLNNLGPAHSVGRYYYLLIANDVQDRFSRLLGGPIRAVMTRYHLTHPWWVPVTLLSEMWGLALAMILRIKGPKHVHPLEAE